MTESQQATPAPGIATAPSTAWSTSGKTPLRQFLRTETGSAADPGRGHPGGADLGNLAGRSYQSLWSTELLGRVGGHGIDLDLREFVNSGLMALFFLVVGLEARREFDMGELRVRSRVALPFLAGLGGMLVPVAHLPGRQRRPALRARLGHGDVHRHRVRARRARAGRRSGCPTGCAPTC